MDRRKFFLIALVGLGAPRAALGQGARLARIAVITFGFAPESPPLKAFLRELRELGYVEGKTLLLEYRFAQGQASRLASLASEVLRMNVDVIVTEGTPTAVAVKRATQTVPVVMAVVSDPVGLGLVSSLSRPGGNMTGLTFSVADRPGKQLQLLKEIVPRTKIVGVLHNAARPDVQELLREANAAAQSLELSLRFVGVKDPAELDASFEALINARPEALVTLGDGMLWGNRRRIVEFAIRQRLPAVYPEREFAEEGGLMAYGPDVASNFRLAAALVDKILKGAKPADLPIERPTKLELVINMKTAAALGVKIPGPVLVRADELIQ
jgi:putative ABC transport system substrate-binding protein